jgi:hypothetical protein
VIATLAVVAALASCTRSEGETEVGGAAGGGGAEATAPAAGGGEGGSRLDQGAFGELEGVCGTAAAEPEAGAAAPAAEVGLTAEEVRIGTVTDKGSAERPGLTEEMYDTAVAFAAWCNEVGGLQGRQVVVDDLDARLFEHGQRIAEACEQDFAIVGGGGVFDGQGVTERVACGLPAIPGYTVTPAARTADLQVQPVPNPIHEFQAGGYRAIQESDPDATKFGILWVNLDGPATVHEQTVDGVEEMGFDVVFDEQYRPVGETGWRGLVQRMRDADVQVFEIIGEPENMVALQSAMQTEGWYPDWTVVQPNFLDERYLEEGGATMGETTYARSSFPTFDMADEVPAMADYLELMERYNPDGKVATLGTQSLSALLLFATSVNECGAGLTRQCLIDKAAAQDAWTAGGLHSPQDPGNAEATECSLVVHISADGFDYDEGMTRPNEGIYRCDPESVVALPGDYGVPTPAA